MGRSRKRKRNRSGPVAPRSVDSGTARREASPSSPVAVQAEPPSDPTGPSGPVVLRDQRWALHAYNVVAQVPDQQRKDYKIAVNDLGANILRGGLVAAMAAVERLGNRGKLLLEHLASAGIAGLDDATAANLPSRIRELDVDGYILATREMLQVATWLKRATQAMFGED